MNALALALPWFGGILIAFFDGRKTGTVMAAALTLVLTLAVLLSLLSSPVVQVVDAGGWAQGIGIRLRVDALGLTFASICSVVALLALVHEWSTGVNARPFPALVLLLIAGLNGLFFTADAFNFYVFFEITMTSAFGIASYGGGKSELRATLTFVVVNLLGSVFFLFSVVALYHLTGTLDFEQLAGRLVEVGAWQTLLVSALLFSAFALKLGLFPFHFWVAPVYRGAHPAVAALLAGAVTNLASYGLLRFGFTLFPEQLEQGRGVLWVLGSASALYGSILALRRSPSESVAYTAIAHGGFMLLGLVSGGIAGVSAVVLLAISGAVDKATLFLALDQKQHWGRVAFGVAAFSSVGVPVTVGFLAKAALLRALVLSGHLWAAGVVVISAGLGLLALFRTFHQVKWAPQARQPVTSALMLTLVLGVVAAGAWPAPLLALARRAAESLPAGGP